MRRSESSYASNPTLPPSTRDWPNDSAQAFAQEQFALRRGSWQCLAKRLIDIVGALFFFLLFTPLYLLVAVVVFLAMGPPVHYWQERIGAGGRRFCLYKFRSMVPNAEVPTRGTQGECPCSR
jgi:lipopolysaccharide/colanic/teichoic acid biosynthesis glycosyltransferase